MFVFSLVLGVQTFGSDSSDPTRPMSFPNYSDPLVANWSTGHDSITLTPSIFDSAVLGTYSGLVVRVRQKKHPDWRFRSTNTGDVVE